MIDQYTAYPELWHPINVDDRTDRYAGFREVSELALDSTGNIYFSANLNDHVLYAGEVPFELTTYYQNNGRCIFKLNIAVGTITHIAGADCFFAVDILNLYSTIATGALATEVVISGS